MTWSERPVTELLAALRSSAPTPGGGSAAALSGALGASLLAMVGGMASRRAESTADADRLREAGNRAAALSEALTALVDRDSLAYDAVMAAYKLPKDSDGDRAARSRGIQEALHGAIAVPLEVMRCAAEAVALAPAIAALGNPNAASDVGVALELLGAALRGAGLNVAINLAGMKDASAIEATRDEERRITAAFESAAAAARASLPPLG